VAWTLLKAHVADLLVRCNANKSRASVFSTWRFNDKEELEWFAIKIQSERGVKEDLR
jgi:hypothetical protein